VVRYFAYGTNLLVERLRERGIPFSSARPGVVRDFRLAVERASRDGPARSTLVHALGGRVHGVLYELEREGLESLGLGASGLDMADVLVECTRLDGGVEVLAAKALMAHAERHAGLPPAPSRLGEALGEQHQHGLPEPVRDGVERAGEPKKPRS